MSIPYLLIIPIAVGLTAQLLKFFFRWVTKRDITLSYINSYGGFPSAHTAFMVSISMVALLAKGWESIEFAICAIMTIIVVRDALGLRMYVSEQARAINKLNDKVFAQEKQPMMEEHLGHKISETIGGAVIGVVLTFMLYAVFVG